MKPLRKEYLIGNAFFLTCILRLQGQGTLEAVNVPPVTGVDGPAIIGYVNNGTVGWAFSPSQDVVISSLGLLEVPQGESLAGVSVGVWSTDGTLLRSTGIDGNAVTINSHNYESISPLAVAAGTTLIIGAGTLGNNFAVAYFQNSPTVPPINFAGTASLQGDGFAFPTVQSTVGDTDRFIPEASFLFQPVPEPGTLGLMLCGAGLLGISFWRQRGEFGN
jgi:hypothetical protein